MFEYQIEVSHGNVVVFKTEWHVGIDAARRVAWLLASKFGEGYAIVVRERREPFVATPWNEFAMDAPLS